MLQLTNQQFKRINTVLLVLIIAVNGYLITAPFLSQIGYGITAKHQQAVLQAAIDNGESKVSPQKATNQQDSHSSDAAAQNQLIVPSMLLDGQIYEGSVANTYRILDQGIWRWPLGSTPDQGGNTVLVGHRFTYTQPRGVFYFMDKVSIGDKLAVIWQGHQYNYIVSSIDQVAANDIDIIRPTADARLTMYTCTPLFHPTQRLVVVAERQDS